MLKKTYDCNLKNGENPCFIVVMLAVLFTLLMRFLVSPAQYMIESVSSIGSGLPYMMNCNMVSKNIYGWIYAKKNN